MSNDSKKNEKPAKEKEPSKSDELDLETLDKVAGGMIGSVPGGGNPPDAPGGGCISQL
jgi:hypothetical protein